MSAIMGYLYRRLVSAPTESTANYLGVVVPLEEAHLHSHSRRVGRTEFEERPSPDGDGDDEDPLKDAEESRGMLEMSAAEYTIEGLRKEVRRGRGEFSDYERAFMMLVSGGCHEMMLTPSNSQIQAHQQGHPGHWHGHVQLAALCAVRLWLVRRQVSAPTIRHLVDYM